MGTRVPRFGALTALTDLDPFLWPDPPRPEGRRGTGMGLHCPIHGDHRIILFFANPLDGGPPEPDVRLYDVIDADNGHIFETITVTTAYDESFPIEYGCGAKFWIAGGAVLLSSG